MFSDVIDLILKVLISYLLGSVIGSLLVGRLRGGVDIRTMASGNAGATNALRTQGKGFAFWVLLIDIAKGWLATAVVARLAFVGPLVGGPWQLWAASLCRIAVMAGHIFPLWYGFRGGKGVATLVGVILGLQPALLLPVLVTWLLAAILFGYVGLASIIAAASLPIAVAMTSAEPHVPLLTFAVVAFVAIVLTHRKNIARMRSGTEPRARRLWLFGKGRA